MTPDRFRDCLAALDWSQRGLAQRLGLQPTTVRRWAAGTGRIPEEVARWLERVAQPLRREPRPGRMA
ncbi:hypothetical protein CCS01_07510 [Rhodopila globiformis]|uniref:HTH cro/C1-type domain-containing protein n=1 Tax=Rhodopila globiformis TaxID=1071 RepID=A0A2S6NK88_RHOGL|nr:hypothetical protein CCS01_07510 [Rhodopila globiformis]